MLPSLISVVPPDAAGPAARVREVLVGEPVLLTTTPGADVAVCWGATGLAAAVRGVRERTLVPFVVAVLESGDATSVRRAVEAGVDGAVLEADLAVALPVAVRGVVAGLTIFPREGRRQLAPLALSHRERQVLALLVEGCTNAEIGGRLFLAESTVKSHLSSAFSKLGVRSRRDAVALILDPTAGLSVVVPGAEAMPVNRFAGV